MNSRIIRVLSLISSIISMSLVVYFIIKYAPDLIYLTRPCAFLVILEIVHMICICALFITLALKPKTNKTSNALLMVIMLLTICCLCAQGMQLDYLFNSWFWDAYSISIIDLAAYFIVLFYNVYFEKKHYEFQTILCIVFVTVTVIYQDIGLHRFGIYINSMIVILPLITLLVDFGLFSNTPQKCRKTV
ncbi:MAG: hypothetical protein E7571_00350 [Ruminococcaceae bacterium]|nr:hypothetical protein [Oscillospiraceae bacterium]